MVNSTQPYRKSNRYRQDSSYSLPLAMPPSFTREPPFCVSISEFIIHFHVLTLYHIGMNPQVMSGIVLPVLKLCVLFHSLPVLTNTLFLEISHSIIHLKHCVKVLSNRSQFRYPLSYSGTFMYTQFFLLQIMLL